MLVKEYGLIFFFWFDCLYCYVMVLVLCSMFEKYGIEVLVVLVDGVGLFLEYLQFIDGCSQVQVWGVECVLVLFIGLKIMGDYVFIGFGQMVFIEIINCIFVLIGIQFG